MTEPIADILDRAADLIEPEGAWTQGVYARREGGAPVNEHDPRAICFCAYGAVRRAQGPTSGRTPAMAFLAEQWGDDIGRFVSWNDTPGRRQKTVVAKLREAASLARSEEGE